MPERRSIAPLPGPVPDPPIGTVRSPLDDPATAPKQGDEGAPDAWLVLDPALEAGLEALDGTPIVDLKPVLSSDAGER
jgi:tRNA (Thr-GGU) A37 N-methylase